MFIMEDEDYEINKLVYEFQMNMIYWNNYIKGLEDYLHHIKVTPKEKDGIEQEIRRIQFYINGRTRIIKQLLN